jgi:hypothetical protein
MYRTSILSLPRELRAEILRYLLLFSHNRTVARWLTTKAVLMQKIHDLQRDRLFTYDVATEAVPHLLLEGRGIFDVKYRLHLGILRVNKLFLDKGSRVLYRENSFAAIRSQHAWRFRF